MQGNVQVGSTAGQESCQGSGAEYSQEGQDPGKTGDLLQNMSAYASLLRHHIHVEDHVFYPMARKTLDEDEMAAIGVEFEKQRDKHGDGTFERNHKLVVDMGSMLSHLR